MTHTSSLPNWALFLLVCAAVATVYHVSLFVGRQLRVLLHDLRDMIRRRKFAAKFKTLQAYTDPYTPDPDDWMRGIAWLD